VAKILIVDDMASMRKMVAFTLENAGHEAVQADDGGMEPGSSNNASKKPDGYVTKSIGKNE